MTAMHLLYDTANYMEILLHKKTQKNTKPVYLENHVNKRIPLGFVLCTYNSSLVMESRHSESVLYFGCVIMTGQIMCTLIVLNFSSISEYS